ncbi:MAG: hypothetical protein ABIH03_04630 [Pseudomonadota bacterium]
MLVLSRKVDHKQQLISTMKKPLDLPPEYRALRCIEELESIIEEAGEAAAILCLPALNDLQADMTDAGILTERKPTDDPPY